jgi:putative ABC transport system ATP-binding protein
MAMSEASPDQAAARIEDGVKVYGTGDAEIRALDGVTRAFPAGRFTAIMGPSGSGKSTLMHCMAGLDRLTSGTTWIGEIELSALGEKDVTAVRRDKIGFIFQAFNLLPMLTALENIRLPLDIAGRRPDQEWLGQVVSALELSDRLGHRPGELSGGQQQRVAAARAFASQPAIVFADEPTGQLDSRSSAELMSFMRHAVDEFAQTIVMVTHDPNAASYADDVVFLSDGKVVGDLAAPSPASILDRMKTLSAAV